MSRTITAVPGAEQAHIYRDRLRGVELALVQKRAAKLAGDEVSDDEVKVLEDRAKALEDAAKDAEKDGA